MPVEIAGHTDAQGSEEGNRALSQARAEAVLVALQGRRVDVSLMRAKGYGEERPIADNETEEGREANRRIEFSLIGTPAPGAAATAATPAPTVTEDAAARAEAAPSDQEASAVEAVVLSAPTAPSDGAACIASISALLSKEKITFDPGSDDISETSSPPCRCPVRSHQAMSADTNRGGGPYRFARHLAQQPDAVGRSGKGCSGRPAGTRCGCSLMKAVGYGEDKPIADNDDEEGREANRRIEFTLITPAGTEAAQAEAANEQQDQTQQNPAPRLPDGSPDFSADTSPSVAPQQKTLRPLPRPANNG